ncbi:MAG: sterol desaturase family protein [Saprospiraceae bacterium]|nr:sterol desaturase family protein [Saprospiraceae bacterium]
MLILAEKFGYLPAWLFGTFFIFMRYLIMAGLLFLVLYYIRPVRIRKWKIQKSTPGATRIFSEIGHSLSTAFIFALIGIGLAFLRQHGYTLIYQDITGYGLAWIPVSFVLLVLLHDTYFYWVHRLIHRPPLFRILHKVHHQSHNPTPWAALSFHPLEAFLEIAIVPIAAFIIPFHPLVLLAFASWSLIWNVIGHAGYELFPSGFSNHPVFKWFNTSTHHNMHHTRSRGNYGLYFNFWDRIMGTNFPDYEQTFEAVKQEQSPLGKSASRRSKETSLNAKTA